MIKLLEEISLCISNANRTSVDDNIQTYYDRLGNLVTLQDDSGIFVITYTSPKRLVLDFKKYLEELDDESFVKACELFERLNEFDLLLRESKDFGLLFYLILQFKSLVEDDSRD